MYFKLLLRMKQYYVWDWQEYYFRLIQK